MTNSIQLVEILGELQTNCSALRSTLYHGVCLQLAATSETHRITRVSKFESSKFRRIYTSTLVESLTARPSPVGVVENEGNESILTSFSTDES